MQDKPNDRGAGVDPRRALRLGGLGVVAVLLVVAMVRLWPSAPPDEPPSVVPPEPPPVQEVVFPDVTATGAPPETVAGQERPRWAALHVRSSPPGAEVYINGRLLARSPCIIQRMPPSDSATVELKLPDHIPYRQKLQLPAGRTTGLSARLQRLPTGISIVTIPPGADVVLNSRHYGLSPVSLTDLDPGTYQVRIAREGYETVERTVEVERYQKLLETFELVPTVGSVVLNSAQPDVTVSIDGRDAGITTTQGNAGSGSGLVIGQLEPGKHQVTVSKEGYVTKTYTVQVTRGADITLNLDLEPVFQPNYAIQTTTGKIIRGRLIRVLANGSVRIEIAPGQYRNIPANIIAAAGEI